MPAHTPPKSVAGLSHKVRGRLEEANSRDLVSRGVPYEYEKHKLKYTVPATPKVYTPDFRLPNGIFVETKGQFTAVDRMKMLRVIEQNPDADIRMVFQVSSKKLYKGSRTSYADWCKKHGIKYADKLIPEEWVKETK